MHEISHWAQLIGCGGSWWDKDAGTKLPMIVQYFPEGLAEKRTNRQTYHFCEK
jgi:hypothetical protein